MTALEVAGPEPTSGVPASGVAGFLEVADRGDRGVATVWAVGAIAVLLGVALFGMHLGAALVARHQAESAADLAALAGAGAVVAGEQAACAEAGRITERMRVRLLSCQVRGWDVSVEVAARPAGATGVFGQATGRARAGPFSRPATMIN